jgi:hypothetical protein
LFKKSDQTLINEEEETKEAPIQKSDDEDEQDNDSLREAQEF